MVLNFGLYCKCAVLIKTLIVQTRDLADTIVSIKDDIDKSYSSGSSPSSQWIVSLPHYWPRFSETEKYLCIARHYAYWHVDFVSSWAKYSRGFHCTYDEVTTETSAVVAGICDFFKIAKSSEQIDMAIDHALGPRGDKIRFNKGVTGRGVKLLCPKAMETVREAEKLM